jgi:hypothetical protein
MDQPVADADDGGPGIVFLGVLMWPPLLPSLVATASIPAGSAMLMMAFVMRRVGGCSDGVMVLAGAPPPPARAGASLTSSSPVAVILRRSIIVAGVPGAVLA